MKLAIVILISMLAFAGDETLPEVTRQIVRKSDVNRMHQALSFDLVPRNSAGVAADTSGSLGTASLQWSNLKLVESFNIRSQLGPARALGALTLNASSFNNTSYASITGGGVSLATTGRPLLFHTGSAFGVTANPSYLHLDAQAQHDCRLTWKITIDGATVTEQTFGDNAGSTTTQTDQVLPSSIIFAVYNGELSSGSHAFDVQAKVNSSSCSLTQANAEVSIYEL